MWEENTVELKSPLLGHWRRASQLLNFQRWIGKAILSKYKPTEPLARMKTILKMKSHDVPISYIFCFHYLLFSHTAALLWLSLCNENKKDVLLVEMQANPRNAWKYSLPASLHPVKSNPFKCMIYVVPERTWEG